MIFIVCFYSTNVLSEKRFKKMKLKGNKNKKRAIDRITFNYGYQIILKIFDQTNETDDLSEHEK